jgi:RNA polymerase sigma factor (sigma-70 family)
MDDSPAALPGGGFPRTRRSVLRAVRDGDPEVRCRAWEDLATSYWRPVYRYLRLRWRVSPEEAEDLTQELFARALQKGTFDAYDPARARFRTFLRTCLDGLVANERKAASRLKRGGGQTLLSLDIPFDFAAAESEVPLAEPAGGLDPEELFRREWVRDLFATAVERLRRHCEASGRAVQFALFERYDLDGPDGRERLTYADLAAELGLPVTQVTNHLAAARRELRRLVLERLRELSGSKEELRAEAREVLGVEPR